MFGKHPVILLITGNQGCGKLPLVSQFAGIYKKPMATFQAGFLSESGELFGQQRLKGGGTFLKEVIS